MKTQILKIGIMAVIAGFTLINQCLAAIVSVGQSGIDLAQSHLDIRYELPTTANGFDADLDPADAATFACFGETRNPADFSDPNVSHAFTITDIHDSGTVGARFVGAAGDPDKSLHIDDGTTIGLSFDTTGARCFAQAGTYTFSFRFVDALGNEASNPVVTIFTIKPATPDNTETTIEAVDCTGKYANNSDDCETQIILRDQFSNVVSQLEGDSLQVIRGGGGDPWTDTDANLTEYGGTAFYDGVKIADPSSSFTYLNGGVFQDFLTTPSYSIGVNGKRDLSFRAITPSLEETTLWQQVVTRDYPFHIKAPSVLTNGDVSTDSNDDVVLNDITAPLEFDTPLAIEPEPVVGTQVQTGVDGFGQPIYEFQTLFDQNAADAARIYECDAAELDPGNPAYDPAITPAEIKLCPEWNQGQEVKIRLVQEQKAAELLSNDGVLTSDIFGVSGEIKAKLHRSEKVKYKDVIFPLVGSTPIGFPALGLNYFPASNGSDFTSKLSAENSALSTLVTYGQDTPNGEEHVQGQNYSYLWEFETGEDYEDYPMFQYRTQALYDVDSRIVSYFAGQYGYGGLSGDGSGRDNSSGALPILINGTIVGDKDRIKLADRTVIGEKSNADVRSGITKNAFQISQSATNVMLGDHELDISADFATSDVLVVKQGDLLIGDGNPGFFDLPAGRKTVVVEDGNVIIAKDLQYQDSQDSFGIIVINTTPEAEPDTGNIYVYQNVKTVVGSYFADGGMSTVDSISSPNVVHGVGVQLRLTGTLLSRNTIGGAPVDESSYLVENLFTPWRQFEDTDDGPTSLALAKRYDLNYIRQWTSDISTDPNYRAESETRANPFILDFDRKSSELAPPGFDISGALTR